MCDLRGAAESSSLAPAALIFGARVGLFLWGAISVSAGITRSTLPLEGARRGVCERRRADPARLMAGSPMSSTFLRLFGESLCTENSFT